MRTITPPFDLLRPRRAILGVSAVLLPFDDDGTVDWVGFESLVSRTVDAGLVPAVNMDTGYVNVIDDDTRDEALGRAAAISAGGRLVAGAFVADEPGAAFALDDYRDRVAEVVGAGATPVIFPSYGLATLASDGVVDAHEQLAGEADGIIAFELSTVFAPFGRIYDLETYEALLGIPGVIGAKHSSLDRGAEWDRLRLRDRVRPDFHVFTGNDLAIDMVMYGSDYLLGLSAFAPDAFARRDAHWLSGDASFHQLNDVLQYLGAFAFRDPVPAYKHAAAMFLRERGWIATDAPHPAAATRPDSDRAVLRSVLVRLEQALG